MHCYARPTICRVADKACLLEKMHPFFLKKKAEDSETPSTSKAAKCKQRKYNPDYIKYGFTASDEKPQCVECGEVLSPNEQMSP